jgi:malate dehydrogenase (oxaloacetate-decarboxylating)(NADP+)
MPVMIDVGTNNKELLANPYYMGIPHPRVEGEAFLEVPRTCA